MAKWARSIVDIEEILVFNVVGFMLRTGFEVTNTYHQKNQGKTINELS